MSANLTQIFAARPQLGVNSAKDDLYYTADVSQSGINKDKAHTRDEMARAIAESLRQGVSKYIVPFLGNVVGLTGGGPNKLDGILDGLALSDVQIPFCVDLSLSDDNSRWKLRAAGGDIADGLIFISPTNTNFAGYLFVRIA